MSAAPLPLLQFRILAYLADAGPSTTGEIAQSLRANRDFVKYALLRLTAGELTVATDTWPARHAITGEGKKALTGELEASEGGES
jgi:hypothetical protein